LKECPEADVSVSECRERRPVFCRVLIRASQNGKLQWHCSLRQIYWDTECDAVQWRYSRTENGIIAMHMQAYTQLLFLLL